MSEFAPDFDEVQPTHDVDTSRQMALDILDKMGEKRTEILRWFRENRDGTANQILLSLKKQTPNQVSPIVTWLQKNGLILETGEKRKTQFGKAAKVYAISAYGVRILLAKRMRDG